MESLNRKLSWDNQTSLDDTKSALKKAMSEVIQSSAASPAKTSPVNVKDEGHSKPEDFAGQRPGRNIEDVERDALDHLFRPTQPKSNLEPPLKSPLQNIRKYLKTQRTPREVTPGEVLRATTSIETETYVIDPITNRRVPQHLSSGRSSFTPKTEDVDVHTNLARKSEGDDFPDDADKYKPVKWNEPDGLPELTPEEQSKEYEDLSKYRAPEDNPQKDTDKVANGQTPKYDDLDDYKPVKWNEPDGLVKPTAEEESKKYKDLGRYEPTQYDDPNAPAKRSSEEESKKYKDLGQYKAVSWNEPNGLQKQTPEEQSKEYTDLHQYGAIRWNEPNGLQKPTAEELTKNYDDLNSYNAVRWNEPDGLQKRTAEELSKEYKDLDKYGAVRWNEPDGLQKETPEELSKNYDDLNKYGAVRWNEPDGLQRETPEELSKHYKDLGEYKPVGWNEPDGLPKPTPEELSKNYDDLQTYDGPRIASNSTLDAYAATQLDTTPKGKTLAPKVEVAAENPGKEYKDLGEYGPVKWNEPDGLQKPTAEELSKNYEDLHLYGAVRWNEPDGLPTPTPEEQSKNYRDVHEYAPQGFSTGPETIPTRVHPEEASKAYKDLRSYGPIQWNEPDGLPQMTPEEKSKKYGDLSGYAASTEATARRHPEELSKEYKDLGQYAQYENDAAISRVHPEEASKQYTDLDQYEPQSFDSPSEPYAPSSGNQSASLDGSAKQYDDLDRYDPQQFDSASTAPPIHPEEATKDYPDLAHYAGSGIEYQKPDGPSGKVDTSSRGTRPSKGYPRNGTLETTIDPLDRLTAQEIRADIFQKARNGSAHKQELEDAKVEHERYWDSTLKDAQDILKTKEHAEPTSTRKFSGNFVRDFPEEFSTSWSKDNSPSKQSLFPENATTNNTTSSSLNTSIADTSAVESSKDETEPSSMDESFPSSNSSRLESSLDRQANGQFGSRRSQQRRKLEVDPYSTTPQGLETSYEQECGGVPTWPTMVKHYSSAVPEKASEEPASKPPPTEEPQSYTILAYDSTIDSVRVAETSSTVHTTTSPLTPAEVIIRLSRPAKFFPYLAPLESRGYEMVSGSGDVLVFHKVREGAVFPLPLPEPPAITPTMSPAPNNTHINPIDMMGKPPITGNFASPTGFVNYDTVGEPLDKPEPPTGSVATGKEAASRKTGGTREQPRKRRSLGRKVVLGVVWTAGIAYAVGVVGEYFASAGRGVRY